jgi:hypothetical protein
MLLNLLRITFSSRLELAPQGSMQGSASREAYKAWLRPRVQADRKHNHIIMSSQFYTGKRLSFDGQLCTVRYHGEVTGTKGEWLGVEWDDPTRGKHSGENGGTRYFECNG